MYKGSSVLGRGPGNLSESRNETVETLLCGLLLSASLAVGKEGEVVMYLGRMVSFAVPDGIEANPAALWRTRV